MRQYSLTGFRIWEEDEQPLPELPEDIYILLQGKNPQLKKLVETFDLEINY